MAKHIVTGTVNVRSSPSSAARKLGQLAPNNIVDVTGAEKEWYMPFLWMYGPDGPVEAWVWARNLEPLDTAGFRFVRWPTDYPGLINQAFGVNKDRYSKYNLPGHEGIDFYAPDGSNIYSVASGQVYAIHLLERDGPHNYGNHVRVRHAGGYKTIYAHLATVSVTLGQSVSAGTILGLADSTGNSTGSHLHLTLKKPPGAPGWPYDIIDPTAFLTHLLPT